MTSPLLDAASVALQPLASLFAPLHLPLAANANLLIFHPRPGGTLRGRIQGEVIDPTGDWVRVMPDGHMRIDVRMTVRLDDGDLLHVTYGGLLRKPDEASWARFMAGERISAPQWYYVVTPQFETTSPRYGWLNGVQALGCFSSIQTGDAAHVAFDLFEVR